MKECKIDKCVAIVVAFGLCNKHYLRYKKYGDFNFKKHKESCSIDGCNKKHFGLGLCGMHYARVRRHGHIDLVIREPLFGDLKTRFLLSFDKKENGCWEWNRNLTKKGYGIMRMNSKNLLGHRISYELHKGEIPKGLFICHSCDNPKCVNPDHLWIGNNEDNVRDMISKGRHIREKKICQIKDCLKIHYCKGLCQKHYSRLKRGKLIDEIT